MLPFCSSQISIQILQSSSRHRLHHQVMGNQLSIFHLYAERFAKMFIFCCRIFVGDNFVHFLSSLDVLQIDSTNSPPRQSVCLMIPGIGLCHQKREDSIFMGGLQFSQFCQAAMVNNMSANASHLFLFIVHARSPYQLKT